MTIRIFNSARELAIAGADIVQQAIAERPKLRLGLPTGATPILLYAELCRRHELGELSFAKTQTFNLDEFLGLDPDHPGSFREFMRGHLFSKVDLPLQQTHFPPTDRKDDEEEAGIEFEALIHSAGGIDLQLLGIGANGHLAFNEPGSSFDSRTRSMELTETTRRACAAAFEGLDDVPRRAMTMGIASILDAKTIVIIATGAKKAKVVAQAIEGPVDPDLPASILQRHTEVTWLLDLAAAEFLER